MEKTLTDCRFCSVVAKANGVDPIGTAGTADYWLIVELPQPWSEGGLQKNPLFEPLLPLVRSLIFKRGILLKVMLIAPDKDYSQSEVMRVFFYRRPGPLFSDYKKQEFILPEAEFTPLVTALLEQIQERPNDLDRFQTYQQHTEEIREILVCTHANVDVACGRFGFPIYKKLRSDYAHSQLRIWRCSHFGGHQFAPTLVDLPQGRFWGHVEDHMLDNLIDHTGSVEDLRPYYRGWAGVSKFEQIAEREVWQQEGWDWLKYPKAGQILALQETGWRKYLRPILQVLPFKIIHLFLKGWVSKADGAQVQIDFTSLEHNHAEAYRANVVLKGEVQTAAKSGPELELKPVKQYQVTDLSVRASPDTAAATKVPLIAGIDLGKQIQERWLWQGINFELWPGEVLGIAGPSGAGKSLLLRAIAGLDPLQTGEIKFCGHVLTPQEMPHYRAQVIYLQQRPALLEGTVEDNLKQVFTLGIHRQKSYDRSKILAYLTDLGRTADFLTLPSSALSGGEAQIVALIRALQLSPKVLLFDEPTASLDPQTVDSFERLVKTWCHQSAQRAYLWVSHDAQQQARMTTRQLSIPGAT